MPLKQTQLLLYANFFNDAEFSADKESVQHDLNHFAKKETSTDFTSGLP